MLSNTYITELFDAVVEATEEAIVNVLREADNRAKKRRKKCFKVFTMNTFSSRLTNIAQLRTIHT